MDIIFYYLSLLENFFWEYIGFALIFLAGLYLTLFSKGFQFKTILNIKSVFRSVIKESKSNTDNGVHPFKLFFTSVGGMVGIGNIVGVGTAVLIGGPGSIFWMWIASILGTLMKYSEIYLGVKHRVRNKDGGYDGGPMYFIQDAFKPKIFAYLAAFFLCIYGVEIYQFVVAVDVIHNTLNVDRYLVTALLLALVLYASMGGIGRLSHICTIVAPVFMITYFVICLYIILSHYSVLPQVLKTIFISAFTGHAAVGAFAGSSFLLAGYIGTLKVIYSGDICIGYESVIQSETRVQDPQTQAQLSIYSLLIDLFTCTLTTFVIAVTGAWHNIYGAEPSEVMGIIFGNYIPYSNVFMMIVLFTASYTTIIAFLAVGIKSAQFIFPQYGRRIYLAYAVFALLFFAQYTQDKVLSIMQVSAGFLVVLNISAILKLRKEINFKIKKKQKNK